jgi:small subunit ribosomal protein S21
MAVNLVIEVEGDIEKALRTMKKKMLKDGMFQEMKKRAYYEKPSVKRRRKAATALKVPQESPRDARARRARRRQEETEMGDGRTVKVIDGNIEAALKKLKRLGREFVPMAAMSPSEEKH